MTAGVLMATPCTNSLGDGTGGQKHKEVRGASFAGSSPPFLGRERYKRTAVVAKGESGSRATMMMITFITISARD